MRKGMLASAETVNVVVEALQRHEVPNIIVDPVSLVPRFYFDTVSTPFFST